MTMTPKLTWEDDLQRGEVAYTTVGVHQFVLHCDRFSNGLVERWLPRLYLVCKDDHGVKHQHPLVVPQNAADSRKGHSASESSLYDAKLRARGMLDALLSSSSLWLPSKMFFLNVSELNGSIPFKRSKKKKSKKSKKE